MRVRQIIPSSRTLQGIILLLAIPAFLWNLGLMTFIGDEAIRTLVALEMKLSGNYITPTLNGELYFNKPPLFNWFIWVTSSLFGYFGEWPSRLTSLLFLALFALTVFLSTRRHFGKSAAFIAAFMLLTSGRILIWDSMLGLIDICFSWVVYLNFLLLFHLGKQGKWRTLFLYSYLLCSAAFLLKGLPAVVFQGASILGVIWLYGSFKKQLLSPAHILGGLAGILPAVLYYWAYANDVSLQTAFSTLFDQSMQRTATHHGLGKTFVHLFTFPFEQVYHFLPWSLLILAVFNRRFMALINEHPFVKHNFWMLLLNIPVYWISVEVYPRYLLMFIPLFNLVCWYVLENWTAMKKVVGIVFAVLVSLIFLLYSSIPLFDRVQSLNYWAVLWAGGTLFLLWAAISSWAAKEQRYLWLIAAMLVLRIGLNGFVLPFRVTDDRAHITRDDASRLAKSYPDQDWYLYKEFDPGQVLRFYATAAKKQMIPVTQRNNHPNALYIMPDSLSVDFPGVQIDSFRTEFGSTLAIMKSN